MQCLCRNCGKEYNSLKARGDWTGFCSAKCQHEKAKKLGYRKGKNSEYDILNRHQCIGDVPTKSEKVKLRAELEDLEASQYANPNRIKLIKHLLATHI